MRSYVGVALPSITKPWQPSLGLHRLLSFCLCLSRYESRLRVERPRSSPSAVVAKDRRPQCCLASCHASLAVSRATF
ncbi:uncharacterized protein J3R85_009499 [Psidium guajava]|nr:uncharacterized protein J3R85_009499 [Psidium guajava]